MKDIYEEYQRTLDRVLKPAWEIQEHMELLNRAEKAAGIYENEAYSKVTALMDVARERNPLLDIHDSVGAALSRAAQPENVLGKSSLSMLNELSSHHAARDLAESVKDIIGAHNLYALDEIGANISDRYDAFHQQSEISKLFEDFGVAAIAKASQRSELFEALNRVDSLLPSSYRQFRDLSDGLGLAHDLALEMDTARNVLRVGGEEFNAATVQDWLADLPELDVTAPEFWNVAARNLNEVRKTSGLTAQQVFHTILLSLIAAALYQLLLWYANQHAYDQLHPAFQNRPHYRQVEKEIMRCVVTQYPDKDFSVWRIVSTKHDPLLVREEPSMNAPVMGRVQRFQWVRFIEKSDNYDWTLVEYKNVESESTAYGWVLSRYLRKINMPSPSTRLNSNRKPLPNQPSHTTKATPS